MSELIGINVSVNCPHCGQQSFVGIDALYGAGTVPQNEHKCYACNGSFKTIASIDVDVEAL